MISGDLNSRVSNIQEHDFDNYGSNDMSNFIPLPLYDHALSKEDFYKNNVSIYRVNKDTVTNDYGYKLINLCNSCDLAMLNGRAFSDKSEGQTTFCGPKGESTVDYVLCDKYVLSYINDFCISDHVPYSDHKMLSFKMKSFINLQNREARDENDSKTPLCYTKWTESKKTSSEIKEQKTGRAMAKLLVCANKAKTVLSANKVSS